MNPHNTEIAIKALNAYAEAARNDFLSLDGEEIQHDLQEIISVLSSDVDYTLETLLERLEITKTDRGYVFESLD